MEIKELSAEYENCSLFMFGREKVSGVLKIVQTGFAFCMYLRESEVNSDPPHVNNRFFVNILTQPYVIINGHHYFDLSFYNSFTIMNEPPRFCFHDITQDPGITINFSSKDQFIHFHEEFIKNLSVIEQDLPGYYKIIRKMRPIVKQIESCKQQLNPRQNEMSPIDFQQIENYNSEALEKLTEDCGGQQCNLTFEEALQSNENLSQFVLHNKIPASHRAKIWCKLAYIGNLPQLNPVISGYYETIKKQWTNLKQSQLNRCKQFNSNKNSVQKDINFKKQLFFTVIPDRQILKLAFNVLMSLCQTFYELHSYRLDLIYMIRVFLAMFTRKMIKNSDGTYSFIVGENMIMSQEALEAAIYWSVIVLLEKAEARMFLTGGQEYIQNTAVVFNQVVSRFSPLTLDLVRSKGPPKYDTLYSIFCTSFCKYLPFCDCADILIIGIASGNIISFLSYLTGISFLYCVPTILHLPKAVDVGEAVIEAFQSDENDLYSLSKIALQAIRENVL